MSHSTARPILFVISSFLGVLFSAGFLRAAEPQVRGVRVQRVGESTYFHVEFARPKGMATGGASRLVPQDAQASHVYRRVLDPSAERTTSDSSTPGSADWSGGADLPGDADREAPPMPKADAPAVKPRQPVPVEGLEFTGRLHGKGEVRFLLIHSSEGQPSRRQQPTVWIETPITLDFDKAEKVGMPAEGRERRKMMQTKAGKKAETPKWPVRDDLEGLWAIAQIEEFGRLRREVSEFGFYSFAIEATARKYRVPYQSDLAWNRVRRFNHLVRGHFINQEAYETTTGAAAIAESLQLQRLLTPGFCDTGKRTVPIGKIEGIDIAEHPWDKMMGDKKPSPEPLAKLIPNDNYYIAFKNVRKFIEFSELLDQWGTNLTRTYEIHSRDYRLKERYQQQLCLRGTELGKSLGPLVLRGLAVTGNDAYLREGSDVAILFHVTNRDLFLAAVKPFLEETRRKFGDQLKESKSEQDGIVIESFLTQRREISLYRAIMKEYVIYANSRVGLQRILDTYHGKHKSLSEARDFQYMRTIFHFDDKEEAGLAYFSDAFIRNLVGPSSKIKEKRRLEALTSMYLIQEAALYHAWETGKPPANHIALLASAGLKEDEVSLPEGKPLAWDVRTETAISDVYNTIHFATPLVELPIDRVTETEAQAYREFRLEYLGLWRRYFDPIGMRIALTDKQVKLDTYILPLVANSRYNELRRVAGDGVLKFDPGSISPQTIAQFLLHLSPSVHNRGSLFSWFRSRDEGGGMLEALSQMVDWAIDPVGRWVLVRADDSPVYSELAELLERIDKDDDVEERIARRVWQMPVMVGMDVKNPLTFAATLTSVRTSLMNALPGALTWGPLEKPYKGVSIVRVQATSQGVREHNLFTPSPRQEPFLPAVYYATIDGAFYLTLNETMLRDFIDQVGDKREGKSGSVEVNSSLYVAPGAAKLARGLIQMYLEKQVHEQALASAPVWYPLYHAGLIREASDADAVKRLAQRYYGFVPVSPDGAAYVYDRRTQEVRNERHGSSARPKTHRTLAENGPIKMLLEQLQAIRADLRFREDGIHTTLTVNRHGKTK